MVGAWKSDGSAMVKKMKKMTVSIFFYLLFNSSLSLNNYLLISHWSNILNDIIIHHAYAIISISFSFPSFLIFLP